jgi:hypothetical protein
MQNLRPYQAEMLGVEELECGIDAGRKQEHEADVR